MFQKFRLEDVIWIFVAFFISSLLIAACVAGSSAPHDPAAPNQVENEMSGSDKKGYCDLPPGNGYANSDLAKIEKFTNEIQKHPRTLTPAQCIAVTAYAKTFDWFGESCLERGADAAAQWIRDCYRDDWRADAGGMRFGCTLLGRGEDPIYQSTDLIREFLRNNFHDCMWDDATRDHLLNQDVIEDAIATLRDPPNEG